jgi:hypothetical protein
LVEVGVFMFAVAEDGEAAVAGEEGGFVGGGGGAGGGVEGGGGLAGVEVEPGEALGLVHESGKELTPGDVGDVVEVVALEEGLGGGDFLLEGGELAMVAGVVFGEELVALVAEFCEFEAVGWACIGDLQVFEFGVVFEERGRGVAEGGGGAGRIRGEEQAEEVAAGLGVAVRVGGVIAEGGGEEGEAGGGDVSVGEAAACGEAVGEGLEGAREDVRGVAKGLLIYDR